MKQIFLTVFVLIAVKCFSQEKLYLWPGDVPGEVEAKHPARPAPTAKNGILLVTDVTDPIVTIFKPAPEHNLGIGIVICPGGGNKFLSTITEGEEVAKWFVDRGFTAFVLQYRVPNKRAGALQDVLRSLRLIRYNAEKWKLDTHKIGVMGFSAGGNLSARAGAEYNLKTYVPVDKADSLSCRPDFAVLIYPGSLSNGPEHILIQELKQTIDKNSSPAFIFVANDDPIGIPLSYAYALRDAKVPIELHVVSKGGHGFGLRRGNGIPWEWPELAEKWINQTLIDQGSSLSK